MSNDKYEHLSKGERQDLFQQFVAHGGKVVNETEKKGTMKKGSVQRDGKNSYSSSVSKSSGQSSVKKEITPEDEEQRFIKYLESYKVGFFSRFGIIFKCYLSKITNLSGTRFTTNFRLLVDKSQEYLSSLKDINHYILSTKTFSDLEIAESFYNNFPLYYEVLIRIKKINIDYIYAPLRESSWQNIATVKEPLYELIRQFYTFMLQDSLVLNSFRKAFQVMITLEETNVKVVSPKLEIVKKSLMAFEEFLRKLNTLFPLISGYDFSPNSTGGKRILGIEGEYMVGGLEHHIKDTFRRQSQALKDKQESKSELFEQEDPKENNALSVNVKEIGAKLVKEVPLDHQETLQADISYYSKLDKVFIVSGLLDFFVKRYSLILGLSKIKFIQTMEKGKKVSIQEGFRDFYIELAKIQRSIKDYSFFVKANDGNLDKSVDMNHLQEQKNQLNLTIRYQTRILLEKILTPLEIIVVSIPEYVIDFDAPIRFSDKESVSGEFYFKGKTPAEAIQEFYAFIKYFVYLLMKGDLAGPAAQIEPNVETFNISKEEE